MISSNNHRTLVYPVSDRTCPTQRWSQPRHFSYLPSSCSQALDNFPTAPFTRSPSFHLILWKDELRHEHRHPPNPHIPLWQWLLCLSGKGAAGRPHCVFKAACSLAARSSGRLRFSSEVPNRRVTADSAVCVCQRLFSAPVISHDEQPELTSDQGQGRQTCISFDGIKCPYKGLERRGILDCYLIL